MSSLLIEVDFIDFITKDSITRRHVGALPRVNEHVVIRDRLYVVFYIVHHPDERLVLVELAAVKTA